MIDRIEELLGSLAAQDEEEQEDVLALPMTEETVPAPPRRDGEEAGDGETGDKSGGRTAGEMETEIESAQVAGEFWKNGPVWTVRSGSPEMDEVQRTAMAGQAAQAEKVPQLPRDGDFVWSGLEQTARGGTTGPELKGSAQTGLEQAGLKGLYRQTVRGLRPAAPALLPEQAGRTVLTQEPGSAASLAVDELDRAVRRDSRRYDGGMSIY